MHKNTAMLERKLSDSSRYVFSGFYRYVLLYYRNPVNSTVSQLTVTLSNPITVENNGLVVLDAYAKDYNRNIATTYKMVDGYDGPAIIVEEGGTLAVNAAKFEGTGIEVDGGTVIVNKGTY